MKFVSAIFLLVILGRNGVHYRRSRNYCLLFIEFTYSWLKALWVYKLLSRTDSTPTEIEILFKELLWYQDESKSIIEALNVSVPDLHHLPFSLCHQVAPEAAWRCEYNFRGEVLDPTFVYNKSEGASQNRTLFTAKVLAASVGSLGTMFEVGVNTAPGSCFPHVHRQKRSAEGSKRTILEWLININIIGALLGKQECTKILACRCADLSLLWIYNFY